MSREHLIDISKRPNFKEITSRGGSVKSDAKKKAGKIRALKLMKLETLEKKGLELVRDPELSALQIIQVIKEMLDKDLTPRTKVELLGKMVQAHTAIHGTKSKNVNVNIEMTSNEVIERLKAWKLNKMKIQAENGNE